jgi:hypothetical protein
MRASGGKYNGGSRLSTHFKSPNPSAIPATAPHADSSKLPVSSIRTTRPRRAPSAMRKAISRARKVARAINRFARLAQPISSTAATAHISTTSERCMFLSTNPST